MERDGKYYILIPMEGEGGSVYSMELEISKEEHERIEEIRLKGGKRDHQQ